jgi:hypothetical protein
VKEWVDVVQENVEEDDGKENGKENVVQGSQYCTHKKVLQYNYRHNHKYHLGM